ncbi:TetR/AcrR family transcriptional regulator [Brevibacillus migulae]|uniref:TetR/AcrR family transcriptional regulator n=1 Tax=Brevibacillus migulae TaxID=1644114 RepID=UPI00106E9380|nr:TetR/AcrR family transcriptional regulator [Brevibacillus migulae]
MEARIIAVAEKEIQAKGLKFTMSDLAKAAGISTKTLYSFFVSKEALIEHIIRAVVNHIMEKHTLIAARTDLDLVEKIRMLLANMPATYGLTNLRVWHELKRYYPAQWALVEQCMQFGWEEIQELMEAGMEQGHFRRIQIPVFIHMYIGAFEQIVNNPSAVTNEMTVSQALDAIIDILLSGLLSEAKGEEQQK